MTDLDTRLDALRDDPALSGRDAPPSVDEVHSRAARRRHRRQGLIAVAVTIPLLLVAVALYAVDREDKHANVVTGPPTTPLPSGDQRSFGDVDGVAVTVTPNSGLHDGDLVDVRVDGLENLPNASIVMCTGDVSAQNAASSCDFGAVTAPDATQAGSVPAAKETTVAVPRFIDITARSADPNLTQPYDCATEPAGCMLAVGPISLPARGVAVPLQFEAEPVSTPDGSLIPAEDLTDGQVVRIHTEGLTPHRMYTATLCESAGHCDKFVRVTLTANGEGIADAEIAVHQWIFTGAGAWNCLRQNCSVTVEDDTNVVVRLPFTLGQAEQLPEPRLHIDPAGPYHDQQDVTVTGTGFRPGIEVGGAIGQCPNDKDTSIEERCSYWDISSHTIGEDGTFRMTVRLFQSTLFTGSCKDGPGCHLGWVLDKGPTLAKVPLTFR